MPDFIQFKITPLGNATVTVPRAQIEGKVVDSQTQQTVIADFTGPNVLIFPRDMGSLTNADLLELADIVGPWLMKKKAGI